MANNVRKANHAGAKNGGGAWMPRADAKAQSNRVRRENDKDVAVEPFPEHFLPNHDCHWITCGYADDEAEDA